MLTHPARARHSWLRRALTASLSASLLATGVAGPAAAAFPWESDDLPDTGDKDKIRIYMHSETRLEDQVIYQGDEVSDDRRCEPRAGSGIREITMCTLVGNVVDNGHYYGGFNLDTRQPGRAAITVLAAATDELGADTRYKYKAERTYRFTVLPDECPDDMPGPGSCDPPPPTPPPAEEEPDPVPTATTLTLPDGNRVLGEPGQPTPVRVESSAAAGGPAIGRLTISRKVGSKMEEIGEDRIRGADDGKKTIMVPALGVGEHEIEIGFPGNTFHLPTSVALTLDVRQSNELAAGSAEVQLGETAATEVTVSGDGDLTGATAELRSETGDLLDSRSVPSRSFVMGVPNLPEGVHAFTVALKGAKGVRDVTTDGIFEVRRWQRTAADTLFAEPGQELVVPGPGVLANDPDAKVDGAEPSAELTVPADHGFVTVHADGGVTYRSYDGFEGTDTFSYRLKDRGPRRADGTWTQSRSQTVEVHVGETWVDEPELQTKPYGKDWETVDLEAEGAQVVDDNPTRLDYTLTNPTSSTTKVVVRAVDADGTTVSGDPETITLTPGQRLDHRTEIDTAGDAWEGTAPSGGDDRRTTYRLQVTPAGVAPVTRDVEVRVDPLPVVLAHGYSSRADVAWGEVGHGFDKLLQDSHPQLRGYAIGDGRFPGVMRTGQLPVPGPKEDSATVWENARQEGMYIEAVRRHTGAQRVDIVAHSMGGLISRRYVKDVMPAGEGDEPVVRHLVQMGTPNMGSPCADAMLAYSVIHDDMGRWPQPSTTELSTFHNERFNSQVGLDTLRGVKLSNLVGTGTPTCGPGDGDVVVPVGSARWVLPDSALATRDILHTDMTSDLLVVRDYVVPRLSAVGAPANGAQRRTTASAVTTTDVTPTFTTALVTVPAGGTSSTPLQVPAGSAFGANALAGGVRAELVDPDGAVKATSPATSTTDLATGVRVEGHRAGRWVLRIHNPHARAIEVPVTAWVQGNPVQLTLQDAQIGPRGGAVVTARLTSGDASTPGTVTAKVSDGSATLGEHQLRDDGTKGDAKAGDGIHTAYVTGLPTDRTLVVAARATTPDGSSRTAMGSLVAVATEPVPPATSTAPVVTTQPKDVRTAYGTAATFTVAATGEVTKRQWQVQRGSGAWGVVKGATGASLTVRGTSTTDQGSSYRLVLTGPGGTTTSAPARLTLTKATPTVTAGWLVSARGAGAVLGTVRAAGLIPVGTVTVRDGAKVIGRGPVIGGIAFAVLPRLGSGEHRLSLTYDGSALVDSATSATMVVRLR